MRAVVHVCLATALFTALAWAPARALVYTNIKNIKVTTLRNGVQIVVESDGILLFQRQFAGRRVRIVNGQLIEEEVGPPQQGPGTSVTVLFPGARNATGKSFINVGEFPVSHIQLVIPESAQQGVGVAMTITLFERSPVTINPSNDQTNVIITVQTSRTVERRGAPGAAEEERAAPIPELTVEVEDGLVSLRAVKADIHQLIAMLARETRTSITLDDKVQRKLSVTLEGRPVRDILAALATSFGLAISEQEGVFMIAEGVPTDLATYSLSETASFRMTNLRAQVASRLLPNFLFGYIHVNPEQNAVVVTAPAEMLEKVGRDLAAVDRPAPQIMIEALVVEFSDQDDLAYALHAEAHSVRSLLTVDAQTGELTYRNIGELPRDFTQRVRFLETHRRARVRSNPRMAALNGRTAHLFIGAQRFIRVLVEIGSGIQQEQIQAVDVGVRLRITPWSGGGQEITSRVEIEVSNIRELDPISGLPVLSTRRVNTTIRLRDGETLLIGGLMQKSKFTTVRKFPLLGDLPLLGPLLFQSRSTTEVDSELTIFLTPRLLTPGGHLPDEAEEQRIRERFLEEEEQTTTREPPTPDAPNH